MAAINPLSAWWTNTHLNPIHSAHREVTCGLEPTTHSTDFQVAAKRFSCHTFLVCAPLFAVQFPLIHIVLQFH